SVHDGVDDGLIARAPAEVARDRLARLVPGRRRVVAQELVDAQEHPRCAEPALQTVLLPERLLHGVELPVRCKTLDRCDLRAARLTGEADAGASRPAVDDDGAGAADAVLTARVGPDEAEVGAEKVEEQQPRLDVGLDAIAVDGERNPMRAHWPTLGR